MKKKKKGFTLVELLVVIAILGIITLLSLPIVRNVIESNTNKKYDSYHQALLDAAKLYNDSYSKDIFGNKEAGCAYISYRDLQGKNLIKDINIDNISCNTSNTFVMVTKADNKYKYYAYMGCTNNGENAISLVYPKRDSSNNNPYTMNRDDCFVDFSNDMVISIDKFYDSKKSISIRINVKSNTGINSVSGNLYYAWSYSNDPSSISSSDWNKASIKYDSVDSQKNAILSTGYYNSKSSPITSPSDATGVLYLFVKSNDLYDLYGKRWTGDNNTDIVLTGTYSLDNTPPKITDTKVIYSKSSDYNTTSVDVKLGLVDETTKDKNKMSVCITFDKFDTVGTCSSGWKNYSDSISVDIPKASYDGSTHNIYIKARDEALNEVRGNNSKAYTYKVYKSCTTTVNIGNWTNSSGQSCGVCGIAKIKQEIGKKDKYLNNSCGTTTRDYSCPNPDCCSQKKAVCTEWKNSGSCSRECAGGSQKQVRTCSYQSTLDSSVKCPGSTGLSESQSVLCNTRGCTPHIESTEGNVTYSCDNNEIYSASDRRCSLKWSGTAKFNVSTYKYASQTGKFYKYIFNSSTNTLLCNWTNDCTERINNGKIYYTYRYDDGTGQSGILYVDVTYS